MGADVGEPGATARASSPSSTTASDGTARRSSRARVGCVRAPSRPAPLRFSIFRYSPEIGQPERPSARGSRLTLRPRAPPIPTPQFIPSIEADSDDDARATASCHLLHLDRARAPSSSAARHGADSTSSGATHTARAAPVHRDESDELAAFERAASGRCAARRNDPRASSPRTWRRTNSHRPTTTTTRSTTQTQTQLDAARGPSARPRRAPRPAPRRAPPPPPPPPPPPTSVADAMSSSSAGGSPVAAGRQRRRSIDDDDGGSTRFSRG